MRGEMSSRKWNMSSCLRYSIENYPGCVFSYNMPALQIQKRHGGTDHDVVFFFFFPFFWRMCFFQHVPSWSPPVNLNIYPLTVYEHCFVGLISCIWLVKDLLSCQTGSTTRSPCVQLIHSHRRWLAPAAALILTPGGASEPQRNCPPKTSTEKTIPRIAAWFTHSKR